MKGGVGYLIGYLIGKCKRVGVPYIYNSHPRFAPRGGVSTESVLFCHQFLQIPSGRGLHKNFDFLV